MTVTSQGGATHTFADNGEFDFEFEDALGNKGSATAKVDWIDRIPPTASLVYNKDETTGKVIVHVVDPSEEITFAVGDGTYEFSANGDYEILFYDKAGNEGMLYRARRLGHRARGPRPRRARNPLPPSVVIISLALGSDAQQTVEWNRTDEDHFYGRMEVLRSKMPTKAEDFKLAVPNGVIIRSITKQVQAYALAHPLEAFYGALSSDDDYGVAVARDAAAAFAAAREGSQSDIWDIVLGHTSDSDLQKTYTLEVVPVEEGEPTPIPTPDPTPTPTPSPNPNPDPGPSPTPTTPTVPTANNNLGSTTGLANSGDDAMGGVLALGILGACFGVLSLVVGLVARSRRA